MMTSTTTVFPPTPKNATSETCRVDGCPVPCCTRARLHGRTTDAAGSGPCLPACQRARAGSAGMYLIAACRRCYCRRSLVPTVSSHTQSAWGIAICRRR